MSQQEHSPLVCVVLVLQASEAHPCAILPERMRMSVHRAYRMTGFERLAAFSNIGIALLDWPLMARTLVIKWYENRERKRRPTRRVGYCERTSAIRPILPLVNDYISSAPCRPNDHGCAAQVPDAGTCGGLPSGHHGS